MTDSNKLSPDAEKALRKLLLEVWSFQGRVEDSSMTTQDFDEPSNELTEKFCNIYTDLDEVAYRGLKLLGFDSWEELEQSVWAKKPQTFGDLLDSLPDPEPCVDMDHQEPCIDMDHQKGYK